MKEKTPYKLPTIVRPANGDWFIKYFYEYPDRPGKFKEFRVRDGINYEHDPDLKEAAVQELRNDITYALKTEGFNPFLKETVKAAIAKKKEQVEEDIEEERTAAPKLAEAVTWFLDEKRRLGRAEKTLDGYEDHLSPFVNWCKENGKERIDEPTIDDVEKYLANQLEDEGWSPRTYNNHTATIVTFFNYLVFKRKLPSNPLASGIERISNRAEKNKYYDQETLDIILPEIWKNPVLKRRVQWQYYTCARGTELSGIKVKDIDLKIQKITISAEIGKTGVFVGKRSVPICAELLELITEEKLKNCDAEWYVFGSEGKPGPKKAPDTKFSDIYWRLKKKMKIDFKYSIYSFKHTRVVDLLVAGFDHVKVMYLTGHTDFGSFQKYIRELGAVMDKQMLGNTLTLKI